MVGIHDLDLIVMDDVTCGYNTDVTLLRADIDGFRALDVEPDTNTFDIENDFGHVLNDTVNRRKLMEDTVSPDRRNRSARK